MAPLSVTSVRAESESSRALARSLFQDLIAINTTDSVGNVTIAAAAMAKRLRAADDNGQVQDKASDRKGFPLPPLDREVMKPLESHNRVRVFHPSNTCNAAPNLSHESALRSWALGPAG